ncbi:MAG: hypothetical protein ACYTDT_07810 [Planctomycetota bacterium]|jgi:hypothetical protein
MHSNKQIAPFLFHLLLAASEYLPDSAGKARKLVAEFEAPKAPDPDAGLIAVLNCELKQFASEINDLAWSCVLALPVFRSANSAGLENLKEIYSDIGMLECIADAYAEVLESRQAKPEGLFSFIESNLERLTGVTPFAAPDDIVAYFGSVAEMPLPKLIKRMERALVSWRAATLSAIGVLNVYQPEEAQRIEYLLKSAIVSLDEEIAALKDKPDTREQISFQS